MTLVDLDTAIELALDARLRTWPGLSSLASYRGGLAIFTRFPVPEDAPDEFVVIAPPIADNERSTKTTRGREIVRDISTFTLATGDPTRVNQLASETREAVRRWQPTLTGGAYVVVGEPSGPIANDGDDIYGRVVSARFIVHGT
jgi:hypothetical protein